MSSTLEPYAPAPGTRDTFGRALSAVITVAALVLMMPVLLARPPWSIVWAFIMVLPHAMVVAKTLRSPFDRPGPALAVGVCVIAMSCATLLLLVQWGARDLLPLFFFTSVISLHAVCLWLAVESYRRGHSPKPHWRLILRGILDPMVYYGILILIAAGSRMHPD